MITRTREITSSNILGPGSGNSGASWVWEVLVRSGGIELELFILSIRLEILLLLQFCVKNSFHTFDIRLCVDFVSLTFHYASQNFLTDQTCSIKGSSHLFHIIIIVIT